MIIIRLRSPMLEVREERVADLLREWQDSLAVALASYTDRATSPVDIVEHHADDVARSQAQT